MPETREKGVLSRRSDAIVIQRWTPVGGSCTMNKDVLEISLLMARGREHSSGVCGHCVGGNTLTSMQAPSI